MLTLKEHKWLEQCARILGVSTPGVREDNSVHDIAYSQGVILLGKKFSKEPPDSRIRRQKLLHETIHHTGVGHDDKARSLRYHSKPEDDWLSKELTDEVERMTKNPTYVNMREKVALPNGAQWSSRYRLKPKLVQRYQETRRYNPSKNSQVISDIERAISENQMNRGEAIQYIQKLYKQGLLADAERRSLVKHTIKWTGEWQNPAFILGIGLEPVIGIILTGIASLFLLRMIGR